jgi:hypothetical protein
MSNGKNMLSGRTRENWLQSSLMSGFYTTRTSLWSESVYVCVVVVGEESRCWDVASSAYLIPYLMLT